MKVILTTNIKKLGKVGDTVNVKNGFARNFLFPQNKALRNTKENLEYYEKIKDKISEKEAKKRDEAIEILEGLKKINITFSKESDEKDQLYGAISKKEILNFLENSGISILSDEIKIIEPIRTLGEHFIEISPYVDLVEKVKVSVKKN